MQTSLMKVPLDSTCSEAGSREVKSLPSFEGQRLSLVEGTAQYNSAYLCGESSI